MREVYPLSLHGVGLSIGSAGEIDQRHLERLKALIERYEPAQFSEHLAWSTHEGAYLNDLLPLPYREDTLATVVRHIDEVQAFLGRRMLLENPSTYVAFCIERHERSGVSEPRLRSARAAACCSTSTTSMSRRPIMPSTQGLHRRFPGRACRAKSISAATPRPWTTPMRRSSSTPTTARCATRSGSSMRGHFARTGAVATLIEWDNDVPDWATLFAEAKRAESWIEARASNHA